MSYYNLRVSYSINGKTATKEQVIKVLNEKLSSQNCIKKNAKTSKSA